MFELREAVLKAGLKINSSSQSIQGKEVLVADSLYGGRVMARYLFLCCNAEFWHNSVKELSEELEEFIQELYFTRRSDLSWNLYFAVVLEPDEYKKLTIYEKNLFMADTEFTRKLIVPTDRFSEMIPVGQIMSKNSDENALLPVMEWRTALEEAGVSSIWLEAFDAGKLETFFSTGSAGENKRERQIKRVPSADEEEIPCSIQSIRIPKDFRPHCYDRDWTLEFPRISLFYGPNGAGKTSILEAIELAMTGSVRGMSREGAERSLNSPVILNAVTKKGQKTVSSNDKQKNMKVREQTWYGTRFDRFTRSQLSPLFHTYNQFSVDDVYLFCQGGQQPDYSGRFSQILFGNEASAIQNHWQRYREETKQRLRKLEEERRGVDNRLAILQKGENSDREALSAYVKHSDFAFDLHDAELPHTICDAVARIQTIYDKLSWSGELPVPDDIPMLLQKSQGETDRLRKLLDEKKAEEERQLGELKAVYWREEENEKEQDRIQDCLTRLARLPMPMELARFLSKKPDFLTQYAEVKEEAQKAQSFQRELELFSTCFGELKTCKEPESELSGAEDTYRRLTERLREAEKTLQSSNEKVRQAQEKTNAMTRVLSEISTAGEQYLKLNENLKACPMCGRPATKETILSYLHKTTGTWTGELSGAMLLRQHCQDAYDRLKDDVKAAEKRVELWRKFQDADQYARERGLDAQLIGRVPQVPVHRVYEVFHLDAQAARQRGEAEAKLAYLWQDELKEPPMRILFLIARQFNQLLQVRQLSDAGMDTGSIAKKLSLNPYITGKIRTQSRSFSPAFLREAVDACAEAETAVKTGNLGDQLAVETLLVSLSRSFSG